MALKELHKPVKVEDVKKEKNVKEFISRGGSLGKSSHELDEENHRLTLRVPKWLLNKVDVKRKERVGKISRNLWILETIEKATKN